MANLLTQETQKNIRREYGLRRMIAAFLLLLAIILFAGILLVPSLLLSSVKVKESETQLELSRNMQTQNEEEQMRALILQTNADVALLEKDNRTPPVGGFVSYILNTKPDAISINGLFYQKAKDNSFDEASLRGIAANREALVSYVTFLQTNGYFSEAVLPISHLVEEKDIAFTISLKIKPHNK